ncbi:MULTISPECIES: ABC transporter permease [unclassified Rhizobium]|jgi:peptide/nickel transport system permease protein|uniref:ABC transporter permease n=1 Tax=unclassified Rhizobium TaxID=2613769 RepID=UPI0006480FA8|nr:MULTISPECIES: ABC transporter permease [unclassified Rhizobium]OJY78606.1 MAG: peptide ABC transporter permease [Rhizobium sp. 60-20]RKD35883.1 peptide/nickel transport system permease protein [Rhizobium sp. WW_1]
MTADVENAAAPSVMVRRKSGAEAFFTAWPPLVLISLSWLGLMILVTLFAYWLAPYDFMATNVLARLRPPALFGGTFEHLLGTDQLGRDVFSRVITSIRISIIIAVAATVITTIIGVTLGFLSAYFRGWVDQVILMLVDAQLAMPFMIIAIAILAFLGNSLVIFVLMLGLNGWEIITRIARSLAISANARGYAVAARDIGASPARIYLRHILPNIATTIIVAMTLNIPGVILLESSLSFLGIGLQPPQTSLGNMVGYGRDYIQSAPWIMLTPAAVIVLTTLSVSIIGDWLRDRLDPTLS